MFEMYLHCIPKSNLTIMLSSVIVPDMALPSHIISPHCLKRDTDASFVTARDRAGCRKREIIKCRTTNAKTGK